MYDFACNHWRHIYHTFYIFTVSLVPQTRCNPLITVAANTLSRCLCHLSLQCSLQIWVCFHVCSVNRQHSHTQRRGADLRRGRRCDSFPGAGVIRTGLLLLFVPPLVCPWTTPALITTLNLKYVHLRNMHHFLYYNDILSACFAN